MTDTSDWLNEILELHFDPRWGSPYWLDQVRTLSFDPRRDIQTIRDLLRFPPFPMETLACCRVEDLIPRRYHEDLSAFITAESGGATGAPKRTAYHPDDFQAAFIEPFVVAAALMDFPRNTHWLYLGPSGPHVIGKAARECARALGSIDPFTVDFDPRWVRKLPAGSLGRTRYMKHVLEQAIRILETQEIGVLFSTPPVIEALGKQLAPSCREGITGIHLGGMAASPGFWEQLRDMWFPNAVVLSGYGNSLVGVCPEVAPCVDGAPVYVPFGKRIAFDVLPDGGASRGTVSFHRLDRACFLPHVREGDEAERFEGIPAVAVERGFHATGLRDPRPHALQAESRAEGFY